VRIEDTVQASSARSLPTGTVTFAFTDIEGSTERWDSDRAGMLQAVRRHDDVMRAVLAETSGTVFKTVGDAFCVAFARPEDAIPAMLAAQRALATEDFSAVHGVRIRAAIHTGTADEREGDYFGPAVNRVARLLAIGHGGQVLVSGVTADLVQGELPPQASLRDLGEHRLKDLARPEQVYQLLAPDLPSEFPPLRSLDTLPNNLPRMLTSFVGREKELADITALLEKHQLVTIVGSGGVGKTRASLQVAANLLDGSGDGVWFIELAPLVGGDYIPAAVAQALGISLSTDGEPLENLVRLLKSKHVLLVFDNCEHLVEPAARVIAALVRSCAHVKVLASSRQGLGIAGEATYRMPSLTLPAAEASAQLNLLDAARYAAVSLFVERASAADHTFELTAENAPTIAEICRRLDGIPLAIELAAARVKILSPRQLRERLNERFRVLTGGSRDALPRQQTLRALIDWSHDLLDDRERALFRRLGIFVNGFALEGAVAVGTSDDLDELDLFDVLASLADKSLVLAETAGDALRYRLLESTRAYAREKLDVAGEAEICADRHLRYLRDRFVESAERLDRTARVPDHQDLLASELDDVRAALDYALRDSERVGAELLDATALTSWRNLGLEREAIARSEAYIAALSGKDARLVARLLMGIAWVESSSAHFARGLEAAAEAVELSDTLDDPVTRAWALLNYGQSLLRLGRFDESKAALDEAEAFPAASKYLRVRMLGVRGLLSSRRMDLDDAASVYEQMRKEQRSSGNVRDERIAMANLAEIEHARGRTQQAIATIQEMMPAIRAGADRGLHMQQLANLTAYLVAADDLETGRRIGREALRALAPREPEGPIAGMTIEHLALAWALSGDLLRAATLEGYALAVFQKHGFMRESTERTTHERLMRLLNDGLEPDEITRLIAEGAQLAPEAAFALALEEP
jgi:predicted ATPase/class 3 adenylate cyclase